MLVLYTLGYIWHYYNWYRCGFCAETKPWIYIVVHTLPKLCYLLKIKIEFKDAPHLMVKIFGTTIYKHVGI